MAEGAQYSMAIMFILCLDFHVFQLGLHLNIELELKHLVNISKEGLVNFLGVDYLLNAEGRSFLLAAFAVFKYCLDVGVDFFLVVLLIAGDIVDGGSLGCL